MILSTDKKFVLDDYTEQNPKSNQIKAFYQLKAFHDSKPFLHFKTDNTADTMTVTLLSDETAKKVFAKLLKVGKAKFEVPIGALL